MVGTEEKARDEPETYAVEGSGDPTTAVGNSKLGCGNYKKPRGLSALVTTQRALKE